MPRTTSPPVIVLIRRDLRLADNPALYAAAASGQPLLIVLAWDGGAGQDWAAGAVAQSWYIANAACLQKNLRSRYGNNLIVRRGSPLTVLRELQLEVQASAVHLNAGHDPPALDEELAIQQLCAELGIECRIHSANVLLPTGAVLNKQGRAFKVFTPYYRSFLQRYRHRPPQPIPELLSSLPTAPPSLELRELAAELDPQAREVTDRWSAGEAAALAALDAFIHHSLEYYGSDRHSLELSGTSRISAWLAVGAISVRTIWDEVTQALGSNPALAEGSAAFLRQLVWREFSIQVLDEYPDLATQPLQARFAQFPWEDNPAALFAWQHGLTGYPAVDAAMRQLLHEGWMPGRARMIVGSFLVKHLLTPWQNGEAWFRDHLIDYDLALNAFNWQWVAGSGADAAPYFRIFNPILQGQRFDADGSYVREWLPELAGLPDKHIHSPWTASPLELQAAGVQLGGNYPKPIVEHTFARERALAALKAMRA